jgi:hypothetical protein
VTFVVKEMGHHVLTTCYNKVHHIEDVDYQLPLSCHYENTKELLRKWKMYEVNSVFIKNDKKYVEFDFLDILHYTSMFLSRGWLKVGRPDVLGSP